MTPEFEIHPKCLFTELHDGTGVVLHLDTKIYYTLNETGVFVWKEIESSPSSSDALVARVAENFDVEPAHAKSDIDALLGTLVAEGLVQRVDGE
jgi:hypothetical protein